MTGLDGFTYVNFGDNDAVKAVNNETGEVTDAVWMCVPVGSRVYTPDSLNARNAYLKQAEDNKLRRTPSNQRFFMVPHNTDFSDLLPATLTRLIFLNTFVDANNRLMLTERKPMQKKDLADVLGISQTAVKKFWNEVCPKYMTECDDGLILTAPEIFIRRKLARHGTYIPYEKFFVTGIRKLYKATDKANHKHLGYIFQMLPFINLQYNILCHNPEETDLDKIDSMSLSDFCSAIGYDVSNLSRLLSTYRKLKFDVNGKPERFCACVYDGLDLKSAQMFVNPHILYNGHNLEKVRILGAFCSEK